MAHWSGSNLPNGTSTQSAIARTVPEWLKSVSLQCDYRFGRLVVTLGNSAVTLES